LRLPPSSCGSTCRARRYAPALGGLDERARSALARDVVARWEPFVADDGSMVMELDVLLATAH